MVASTLDEEKRKSTDFAKVVPMEQTRANSEGKAGVKKEAEVMEQSH